MELLSRIQDWVTKNQVILLLVVILGICGWIMSYLIDATGFGAPEAEVEVASNTEPPPEESSVVPNWGTTLPPLMEAPFFPPIMPEPETNFDLPPEVVQKEYVRRQANYLRTMVQDKKAATTFQLTVEQINEMEKKGITIW